jgi:hypothetical protein
LQLKVQEEAGMFNVDTTIDMSPIVGLDRFLEVGVTAIVQTKDGNQSYWALTHPAPYPDFHLRESFILALAGQTHLARQSAPGD